MKIYCKLHLQIGSSFSFTTGPLTFLSGPTYPITLEGQKLYLIIKISNSIILLERNMQNVSFGAFPFLAPPQLCAWSKGWW